MAFGAVGYGKGECRPLTSQLPSVGSAVTRSHKSPGDPASVCSSSQHRWTKGKRTVRRFPSSKKPKLDNRVLQVGFGGNQEQMTNSALLKFVLFCFVCVAVIYTATHIWVF